MSQPTLSDKKHVLICVVGMSPAVVTETVWYLCVERRIPLAEVWVLTTAEGKKGLEQALFGDGVWDRVRLEYRDFGIQEIDFNRQRVVVFKDRRGEDLQDIRTPEENADVAKHIVEFVREKTADPNTVLHGSVAGGRKTMGVYLACALQLFGRAQDTLSHVLVSPQEVEQCRDFFYPPKDRKVFENRERGLAIASDRIHVEAAEIPFVRLRHVLDPAWLNLDYTDLIARTQRQLDERQIRVCLDLEEKRVEIRVGENDPDPVVILLGERKTGVKAPPHLPGLQAAYYACFLLKTGGHPEAENTLSMIERLYRGVTYKAGRPAQRIEKIRPDTKTQMNNIVEKAMVDRGYTKLSSCVRAPEGMEQLPLMPEQIEVKGAVPGV